MMDSMLMNNKYECTKSISLLDPVKYKYQNNLNKINKILGFMEKDQNI